MDAGDGEFSFVCHINAGYYCGLDGLGTRRNIIIISNISSNKTYSKLGLRNPFMDAGDGEFSFICHIIAGHDDRCLLKCGTRRNIIVLSITEFDVLLHTLHTPNIAKLTLIKLPITSDIDTPTIITNKFTSLDVTYRARGLSTFSLLFRTR